VPIRDAFLDSIKMFISVSRLTRISLIIVKVVPSDKSVIRIRAVSHSQSTGISRGKNVREC